MYIVKFFIILLFAKISFVWIICSYVWVFSKNSSYMHWNFRIAFNDKLNKLEFRKQKLNNRCVITHDLYSLFIWQKSPLPSPQRVLVHNASQFSLSLSLSSAIPLLRTKAEADALNSPQRNRTTATPAVMNASEGCILWGIASTHRPFPRADLLVFSFRNQSSFTCSSRWASCNFYINNYSIKLYYIINFYKQYLFFYKHDK